MMNIVMSTSRHAHHQFHMHLMYRRCLRDRKEKISAHRQNSLMPRDDISCYAKITNTPKEAIPSKENKNRNQPLSKALRQPDKPSTDPNTIRKWTYFPGYHPCTCGSFARRWRRLGFPKRKHCFGWRRVRCPWFELGLVEAQRGHWNRQRKGHRWHGRQRNR